MVSARYWLAIALVGALAACAAPSREVVILNESHKPDGVIPGNQDRRTSPPSDAEEFALLLAQERPPLPMTIQVGHSLFRGHYLGLVGKGCNAVAIEQSTRPSHATNYVVCQGRVNERMEAAPALPRSSLLEQMRDDNAKRAWASRAVTMVAFEGYILRAVPTGYPDTAGCLYVEDYVLYEGLLSGYQTRKVCR